MNNPNRRKDDARPAVALQWGDRPDHWTLMLTGPTSGVIGPLGSTWPEQPADYERVDVCVRRKDGPAAVFRTGGEGAGKWEQFYQYDSIAQPLRDGELLYREGAAPKLDSIEQYRMQMAAIGTASFGYWKEGDTIHPDYDTVPLRDVARLYAKYDELFKFREQVRGMVAMLKNREWAEDLAATGDAADLQSMITELIGQAPPVIKPSPAPEQPAGLPVAKVRVFDGTVTFQDARMSILQRLDGVSLYASMPDVQKAVLGGQAAPDAVEAALADAIVHGTGAFKVKADGSTEHVAMVRDALYPDYATPATASAPKAS